MRLNRWVWLTVVIGSLVGTGCNHDGTFYKRPDIEGLFAKITPGMSKAEVIEILGPNAYKIQDREMWYIYDDPEKPVRLRFVLDDQDIVVEKYYEPKREVLEKYEKQLGEPSSVKPLEGEEERTYPGGPLPKFEKKPGEP
jgi:hypothetical protein